MKKHPNIRTKEYIRNALDERITNGEDIASEMNEARFPAKKNVLQRKNERRTYSTESLRRSSIPFTRHTLDSTVGTAPIPLYCGVVMAGQPPCSNKDGTLYQRHYVSNLRGVAEH